MKKSMFLLSLLLITSFIPLFLHVSSPLHVHTSLIQERQHSSDYREPLASHPQSSLYVSPKLKKVKHKGYLVQFETIYAAKNFKDTVSTQGSMLHTFDTFPYLYLRGNLASVLETLRSYPAATAIYPNQVVDLPLASGHSLTPLQEDTFSPAENVNATYVWENGYQGEGVKVAIIDTGIDNHEALQGRIGPEKSFVKQKYGYDENIGNTNDDVGHGTALAGLIAGSGAIGEKGIAPNTTLVNAKVFPDKASGATDAGIIAAIDWAFNQKNATVINLSLGRSALKRDPLVNIVDKLSSNGALVVTAAGNAGTAEGLNTMSVASPGTAKNAITVGAAGKTQGLARFTSRGPSPEMAVKPDIVAPGTVMSVLTGTDDTTYLRGTSIATPIVAGAVALLVEYCEEEVNTTSLAYNGLVKGTLINTSRPVWGDELTEGSGRINVGNAFATLQGFQRSPFIGFLPRKLPVNAPVRSFSSSTGFPYFGKLYVNTTRVFNFTLCGSSALTLTIEVSGNMSTVLNINAPKSIDLTTATTYWEMNFTVQDDVLGSYQGRILFKSQNQVLGTVPMHFTLVQPTGRLLFDYKHTSWTFSAKYGQYHEFYRLADDKNISVRQYFTGSPPLSPNFLDQFDIVFMPDTLSNKKVVSDDGETELSFTSFESHSLQRYVRTGGFLLFVCMEPGTGLTRSDRDAVNKFLKEFDLRLGRKQVGHTTQEGEADPIDVKVAKNTVFGVGETYNLPYWGINIAPLSWQPASVLSFSTDLYDLSLASLNRIGQGGIFVSGSNFFFDNWAITGGYDDLPNPLDVKPFLERLLAWGTVRNLFQAPDQPVLFSKGEQRQFNFTYSSEQYSLQALSAYRLDAVGMTDLTLKNTTSHFSCSFPMRNARDNYVLLEADIGGWNLGTRLNASIQPQEVVPPTVQTITPKNNSIRTFGFASAISTLDFKLQVSDEQSDLLVEGIRSRVQSKDYTGFQSALNSSKGENGTFNLQYTLSPEVLRAPIDFQTRNRNAVFTLSLFIPDENLNALKLQLRFELRQELNEGKWLLITAGIIFTMVVLMGLYVWFHQEKKKKKVEGTVIR